MAADNPFQPIVDALSAPPIQKDTPHYEALGRFVTAYASAEAAVHMLARKLSGLSDEKARVMFAGMRLGDVTERIRAMMKIDKIAPETVSNVDACLTQLSVIAARRHSLVHRSSSFFSDKIVVTNILTSKSIKQSESESFGISELSDMHLDCGTIFIRLRAIVYPDDLSEFKSSLDRLIQLPWRYKPAPPKTPNPQSQKTQP